MKRLILVISGVVLSLASVRAEDPVSAEKLSEAVGRSWKIIRHSQNVWYDKELTCVSCHHQTLPLLLHAEARSRGLKVDHEFGLNVAGKTLDSLKDLALSLQGYQYIDELDEAWRLMVAATAGVKPNASTSAMAQYLASAQREDGGWRTMDARPPQSYSRFTTTAVSLFAIERYLPPSRAAEKAEIQKKARRWLTETAPVGTEERSFQLLGLVWSKAPEADRIAARELLIKDQQTDGGWAQLPKRKSDAYSTGVALYALNQSGLPATDSAYRKGVAYLMSTQHADGSWRVESRLQTIVNPSPEYVSADFPHGRRHQYISISGTAWAARALALAVPPEAGAPAAFGLVPPDPADKSDWILAALNGSVADVKAALDRGVSPDATTASGTTMLMLAARHPDVVELLLNRGAKVNARADSGLTALHVASRYRNNAAVVGKLLARGAEVKPPTGVTVTNDAAPLFFAAASGDTEIAGLLRKAGADPNAEMKVLGMSKHTPLLTAVQRGDADMVRFLLANGGNVHRTSADGTSYLHYAVITNRNEILTILLKNGARINQADTLGFTALHYAACVDSGSDRVVQTLLAAGADPLLKDKEGKTARDMAQECRHQVLVEALSR